MKLSICNKAFFIFNQKGRDKKIYIKSYIFICLRKTPLLMSSAVDVIQNLTKAQEHPNRKVNIGPSSPELETPHLGLWYLCSGRESCTKWPRWDILKAHVRGEEAVSLACAHTHRRACLLPPEGPQGRGRGLRSSALMRAASFVSPRASPASQFLPTRLASVLLFPSALWMNLWYEKILEAPC